MTNKVKEAIGRLTKINERISKNLSEGPEGSFRLCLEALEIATAQENEKIYKAIELLKEVDSEERVKTTVGYGFDEGEWGIYKDEVGHSLDKHPNEVGAVVDKVDGALGVRWTFNMTKAEAARLYNMLQMLAGLNMPLQHNQDLGMTIDGEHYHGES